MDQTIIEAFLAGDREAFAQVSQTLHERIYRFLCGWLGDEPAAEDLTQEVLQKAFEKRDTFQKRSKFSTWVFGVAVNLARGYRRDRARHAGVTAPESLEQAQDQRKRKRSTLLSSIVRREEAAILLYKISQLPPSLREAFLLRFVEELDYPEMEKITGVSADTLYVRCHRARSLLKREVGSVVDTYWAEKT